MMACEEYLQLEPPLCVAVVGLTVMDLALKGLVGGAAKTEEQGVPQRKKRQQPAFLAEIEVETEAGRVGVDRLVAAARKAVAA